MDEFRNTDFSKMTKNQILAWAGERYIFPRSEARKADIVEEIKVVLTNREMHRKLAEAA